VQIVRQRLNIVRNVGSPFLQFLRTTLDVRRIFFELFEFDCQQSKTLVDIVVELSRDPGAPLGAEYFLNDRRPPTDPDDD
jgi:hypothetical protein